MLIADLSNNNHEPDWHQLASTVQGVWLKATEGRSFVDSRYASWIEPARQAGLRVGAYHFARPELNPDAPAVEAVHFATELALAGKLDLRPALDYERLRPGGHDAAWIHLFNETLRAHLELGPLFYSNPATIAQLQLQSPVGYGLWLASYGRDDGSEHSFTVPAPWKHVAAHQFTSHARLPGCADPVDLSRVLQPHTVLLSRAT